MSSFVFLYAFFLTFGILTANYPNGETTKKDLGILMLATAAISLVITILLHFVPPISITIGS